MATSKQILDEATNMGMSGIDRAIEKRRRTGEGIEKDKLLYSHGYEDARNEYLREARRPTGLRGSEDLKDKEPILGFKEEAPAVEDFAGRYTPKKKGGTVKKMAKGGNVASSASKRADGIAQRGKTKGRFC